jgi:hypothetical protein
MIAITTSSSIKVKATFGTCVVLRILIFDGDSPFFIARSPRFGNTNSACPTASYVRNLLADAVDTRKCEV